MRATVVDAFRRYFAPGDEVFHEGESSSDLHVLVRGALVVRRGGHEVARIEEPGAYVGEMSFLLGLPRSASVVAATPAETLAIPSELLDRVFSTTPELALRLARLLAARLRTTTERLAEDQSRLAHLREECSRIFERHARTVDRAREADELDLHKTSFLARLEATRADLEALDRTLTGP